MSPFTRLTFPLWNELLWRTFAVVAAALALLLIVTIWRLSAGRLPLLPALALVALGGLLVGGSVIVLQRTHLIARLPQIRSRVRTARLPTNVTQATWRSVANGGTETVQGWERLVFQPGQRQAVAHVSFCPPLNWRPNVEVTLEPPAPNAKCKVTHAWPHGARIEVRLAGPPRELFLTRARFVAKSKRDTGGSEDRESGKRRTVLDDHG
jgi:xanthosine utilization system XapX-like protein